MPSTLNYLIWILPLALLIWWMWRSNKKRSDDQRNLADSMKPGQRVMLTSGLFGTIQAVGEQQMVVELAPGMGVTVVKQAVAKVLKNADEEFEYTDDTAPAAIESTAVGEATVIEGNEAAEQTEKTDG